MAYLTKGFGLAAMILGMMAGGTGQASGATIVNGDFEEATVDPGGFYVVLPGGSTAITGWTVTGVNVELIGGFSQASSGLHSVDLSGSDAGGIEQTFATTAGQFYRVMFDLAGDPGGPPTVKTVHVSAGGRSQDFTFDTTGATRANMGYIPMTFDFIAAGNSTTLAFTSRDATFAGPVLDNVTVTAAPEPSTFALGGIALVVLGLGYARRRRPLAAA